MERILVIGGRGFFGSRVVEALRPAGAEVVVAGRDLVDLGDPATFACFGDFDVIVNASDPLVAAPDQAIERVLAEGGPVWIETTGETAAIERLLARRAQPPWRGVVVLGMGIFPGMSNLLARAALEEGRAMTAAGDPPCERVEVGILVSPLSGAGFGMCRQMAELLGADGYWIEAGQRRTGRAVTRGGFLPFASGRRAVLRVGLPESAMLHASTGADVSTYVAPSPRVMAPLLLALAALVPRWRWARRMASLLLYWLFVVHRAVLLRRVSARSELVAIAGGARRTLIADDGVRAGGAMVAAAIAALRSRPRPAPGVYLPDELFTAGDLVGQDGPAPAS